jgi:hypothetical protein
MKKRFSKMFSIMAAFSVVASCSALLLAAPPTQAALFSNSKEQACKGIALDDSATCGSTTIDSSTKINNVIATALNLLSVVVGIIAVIMLIVSGLRLVLSGGDSATVASARGSIVYAMVGMVIFVLAQLIVRFVLHRVTNVPTP